jgi:hypothetical protein
LYNTNIACLRRVVQAFQEFGFQLWALTSPVFAVDKAFEKDVCWFAMPIFKYDMCSTLPNYSGAAKVQICRREDPFLQSPAPFAQWTVMQF